MIIATTRPETMLGDTALAVSPQDDRYSDLIGKNVLLPIMNRPIPIIADRHVDPEFGTGVVKVTPAHDPNDHEMGLTHQLPLNQHHDPRWENQRKWRQIRWADYGTGPALPSLKRCKD